MKIPPPTIQYRFYGDQPGEYTAGTEPLASVVEVSARINSNGNLDLWVTGPMLKKDGTPGRHHRSSRVDRLAEQPEWLAAIMADAGKRLR
jgi:hypothetical protein